MTISQCVVKSMLSSLNVMRHLFANNKIPDIFKMCSLVSLFYAFNVTRDDLLNLVQISLNKETLSIYILCKSYIFLKNYFNKTANECLFGKLPLGNLHIWEVATGEVVAQRKYCWELLMIIKLLILLFLF